MNERISDLAQEAFYSSDTSLVANIKVPREFVERFAELIIEECALIANQTVIGSDKVGDAIKKHFEVEGKE